MGQCARFPNLRTLHISGTDLAAVFPGSNSGEDEDIPHSLRNLNLYDQTVGDDDWAPLKIFLARSAMSGKRLERLQIVDSPHLCLESIEELVQVAEIVQSRTRCPFGVCLT